MRAVADRRLQHERRSKAAVEQELAKFRVYCLAQEREIATLRGILRKHELTIDNDGLAVHAAITAATISVVAEVNSSADMIAVDQLPAEQSTVDTLAWAHGIQLIVNSCFLCATVLPMTELADVGIKISLKP